ncbi:hypothetical protein IKD60_01160 [Candidatus Saccharibacteria bacterium]|nr:hypothetical protein [Candidatus Saccharibacteria bacterium]
MITLQTNENNDLFVDAAGNIAIAGGDLAAMQTVRHAVLTNRGELPLDQQAGVAYFDTVFCDTPNLESFRQNVQQVAEQVNEVQQISDFELQNQDGVLRYQMKVTLKDGSEVTVNG